jgi:hypothetical protein
MALLKAVPVSIAKRRNGSNTLIGVTVITDVYDDTRISPAIAFRFGQYISGDLFQRIVDHPNRATSKLEMRMVIKELVKTELEAWNRMKDDEEAAAAETVNPGVIDTEIGAGDITDLD